MRRKILKRSMTKFPPVLRVGLKYPENNRRTLVTLKDPKEGRLMVEVTGVALFYEWPQ